MVDSPRFPKSSVIDPKKVLVITIRGEVLQLYRFRTPPAGGYENGTDRIFFAFKWEI